MITIDRILSIERKGLYKTRPNFHHLPLPTATTRVYTLEFWKNKEHSFFSFRAKNNGLAVIKAMHLIGIKGKLTKRKLIRAGVEKVFLTSFGGRIFLPRSKR